MLLTFGYLLCDVFNSQQVKDFLAVGDAHRGVTFLRYSDATKVGHGMDMCIRIASMV